jgi:hypothetical protein
MAWAARWIVRPGEKRATARSRQPVPPGDGDASGRSAVTGCNAPRFVAGRLAAGGGRTLSCAHVKHMGGGMPEPYTDNETRILLSFAMDNHGAAFAYWLRDKLMKAFDYYSTNAVYMDCVASRDLKSFHATKMDDHFKGKQLEGFVYVAPDDRDKFKGQGYKPIGALNPMWNQMYQAAMAHAKSMVMVVTPEYLASEWCLLEWQQFHEENQRRRAQKRAPLNGICLRFVGDGAFQAKSGKPIAMDGIKVMIEPRVKGLGGLLWHKEMHGISEGGIEKLKELIGEAH